MGRPVASHPISLRRSQLAFNPVRGSGMFGFSAFSRHYLARRWPQARRPAAPRRRTSSISIRSRFSRPRTDEKADRGAGRRQRRRHRQRRRDPAEPNSPTVLAGVPGVWVDHEADDPGISINSAACRISAASPSSSTAPARISRSPSTAPRASSTSSPNSLVAGRYRPRPGRRTSTARAPSAASSRSRTKDVEDILAGSERYGAALKGLVGTNSEQPPRLGLLRGAAERECRP